MGKVGVFVVQVDNYRPDLCASTIPTIKAYADKISADFHLITERKFPEFPAGYEKAQVYELGKDYDHCISIDADYFIHKDAPDFTTGILPGYVGCFEMFDAHAFFEMDEFFNADGRDIGIAANFVLTDKLTHNIWEPLSMSWAEMKPLMKHAHQSIEYCISRNLAKYRHKLTGLYYHPMIPKLFHHVGVTNG